MEYRFVQLDQSVLPSHFCFGNALTGVFLGDSFPQGRLVALRAALEAHPGVPVYQLRFHNRRLMCVPGSVQLPAADESTSQSPWAEPRRPGTLQDRLTALQDAVSAAEALRIQARAACADVLAQVKNAMVVINQELQTWPNAQIALHASASAIPESQRSRRPGVEGERVHFDAGYMCVVENLPLYSRTFVAAAAIQVLDDEMLRIHAVVSAERWKPDGNEQTEVWRDSMELPLAKASAGADTLMSGLSDAIRAVRSDFEANRRDGTT